MRGSDEFRLNLFCLVSVESFWLKLVHLLNGDVEMKSKIRFMGGNLRGTLSALVVATTLLMGFTSSALADDTSADAPVGFSTVAPAAKGVILRVPVNANGAENTDAAEMKFFKGERSTLNASTVGAAWDKSATVEKDEILLGQNGPTVNPKNDSSTWGWYNWYWNGWQYPYYYTWYRPTFYYYNTWYYYPYYSYWNYNYNRYYYYWY